MKPLWLIGADIARSPSPAMHNAALAALGIEPAYALHVAAAGAGDAAFSAAESACAGINVTAPHKVAAAQRYAAVLDDDAAAAGAVNTVVYAAARDSAAARDAGAREGAARALVAMNTDVAGLLVAWRRSALVVEGKTIAIVGAGGAARAAVVAAQQAGARAVVVHARKKSGADALVALAARLGLEAIAAAEPCGATLAVLAASDLDDPATAIEQALATPGAVHDLRYGARARPSRDAALARRHLFVDGSLMLLAQAQLALAAFLGAPLTEAAASAMRRALAASM